MGVIVNNSYNNKPKISGLLCAFPIMLPLSVSRFYIILERGDLIFQEFVRLLSRPVVSEYQCSH